MVNERVPERILAAYLLARYWLAPTPASPYWVSPKGFVLTLPQAVLHQLKRDYGPSLVDSTADKEMSDESI